MKPKVAVLVLSGVLLGMLGVGLSQTANTVGNSNTVANCTEADRRPRKLANGGNWTAEMERLRNIDANTGKPIMNGSWNANCARWDLDHKTANYASNTTAPANGLPGSENVDGNFIDPSTWPPPMLPGSANVVMNSNTKPPRKRTQRKPTRRP